MTTPDQPDVTLDDLTLRYSREDVDAAYERGLAARSDVEKQARQTLRRERDAAHERGVAEGRREATEGWEREWGERRGRVVSVHITEAGARRWAADVQTGSAVVSRLVGPWEPAEQVTPVTDAQYADQFQRIGASEAVILAAELAEQHAHMAAMEERHQHEAEQDGDGRG